MSGILKGLQLNELSNDTLASYKKKAGADATASDKAGDTKKADKRFSGIVKATKKQFANDAKGLKEDFEDLPDELMDPAVWKKLPINQKYKALVNARLTPDQGSYYYGWMNGDLKSDGKPYPDDVYTPYNIKNGELDLNKVYRKALAKYQDRKHSADLTSQDREYELEIGTAGRAEIIRKANELAEMKRVTLRNERLHDEEVAFQRAETIQQRKDEMKKIEMKYQHDLTVIDKEHRNNMEAIRTGNNHEINKIDKEYAEASRVRDWESSERDKDRPKPEKPRPEPEMPEPEEQPRPRPSSSAGNNFDQDTGEPLRPQSNQWHTSQQVGYTPTKPVKKDDDVTDVEPKPNKPLALGNSVKEAGPGVPFRGVGGAFNRGDDERHDLDVPKQQPPQIWGLKINGKVWQKNGKYVTFNSKEAALLTRNQLLRKYPDLEIGLVTQGGSTTQSAAPTKPAPQKPLMAVSLDRWKQSVLNRYPEARFATQKMINGATIATDRSGQVGIYDPKNSYAKVGPEGVTEGEGNFVGDTPVNLGGDTVKRLQVGDIVKYFGQKAKILAMSKTGNTSRITIANDMGGVTKDVLTRDLKRTGLSEEELDENLHKWFKEKWVRFGPDGKIRGDCARGDDSEGKPKCLPQKKAQALGKKGRASAASRKRREDPNPERSGKAINVNTKKKSNESINESIPSDNDMGSTPRGSKMTLGQWKQMWQKKMPNADMSLFRFPPSMPGSAIAYFDGWMNNPDARWDPKQGVAEEELDEACWKGYHKEGNKELFGKTVPNCVKNTNEEQDIQEEKCPHCGGPMFSEMIMNEKKDACYYKVKSRYKVWPSAYASGALVKCRKKGASNWGTGGKSNESIEEDQLDEKWSKKYKDSIKCSNPKGFSQKAHCAGKQKNESAIMSGLNQLDEGWKEKLGAAALAGSMALGAGAAHSRVTPDGQGGFTGGLKPTATVTAPSDNKPSVEAPKGFSKEYLQKAADPNRTGKYMISVEKAQELLKNMP